MMGTLTAGPSVVGKPFNRLPRPNYALLHARPLPLEVYPLPAFVPHNPLSVLRIAYVYISQLWFQPSSHPLIFTAYYSPYTNTINVTDPSAVRALWERGFFGKGSLSRSEPEWLNRERRRRGLIGASAAETSAEVTRKRREERRLEKRERARREREVLEEQLRKEGKLQLAETETGGDENSAEAGEDIEANLKAASLETMDVGVESPQNLSSTPSISVRISGQGVEQSAETELEAFADEEHLQLAHVEAFFLSYGLGAIEVLEPHSKKAYTNLELLTLFRRTSYFPPRTNTTDLCPDDPFLLSYVVYHHFRSLGWVVRPGVKFAVDFLIYHRGPVFSHAEFAVLILPSYEHPYYSATESRRVEKSKKESKAWWWLHSANRVQTQVRKSLVLVYVEIPPPTGYTEEQIDIGKLLRSYQVREFCVKRWAANRNRD